MTEPTTNETLAVVPQQVVPREPQSANRRLIIETAMQPMPMVSIAQRPAA